MQAFTYKNIRRQVKRRTLKHWHGRLGKYLLGGPDQCQLSYKVTALFEPHHAMRYGRVSF